MKAMAATKIELEALQAFQMRVMKMRPKRSVSARIRELIIQDIKRGAKKCSAINVPVS